MRVELEMAEKQVEKLNVLMEKERQLKVYLERPTLHDMYVNKDKFEWRYHTQPSSNP